MADHNLPYVQLDFRFACALPTNVPKFVIEATLRDFRFCILLMLNQSGQSHFVLCATGLGQLTFPLLFPNQPVQETIAMDHAFQICTYSIPGAKMMGSILTLTLGNDGQTAHVHEMEIWGICKGYVGGWYVGLCLRYGDLFHLDMSIPLLIPIKTQVLQVGHITDECITHNICTHIPKQW